MTDLTSVNYDEFVTALEAKINAFLPLAKGAKADKKVSKQARKVSMSLRKDLQTFKNLCIKADKDATAANKAARAAKKAAVVTATVTP